MSDPLYLSTWFPEFDASNMMGHALAILRRFPFSVVRPGVEYVAVQPASWREATVLERRFRPGVSPADAVGALEEFVNSDYAYVFELYWDLWALSDRPGEEPDTWLSVPSQVKVVLSGVEFDEGAFEQEGHVQVDFGLDRPFLHEELNLSSTAETHLRANVQKLVDFTFAVEKHAGISGRLLWSESEENLAQKLIARLQAVQ